MKKCCESFVMSLEPNHPKNGKFSETHVCPTCKTRLRVSFECNALLGGNWACAAISAEEI